ncbi:cell wall-binding repeat-containing protein [Bacillus sp. ISL-37]|uniref:S8 family serine peptidase n=1 Tax=Bacillus sp. ISL-37 TaxID=2819123 RepID=UPI001BE6B97D|nr:cell wall-binding repeat-containing protein [Bacillus sp. ISL-37]MBT2686002.1 cell wall-binding repeat-containing protein [Bacillus sp. ISL-37]
MRKKLLLLTAACMCVFGSFSSQSFAESQSTKKIIVKKQENQFSNKKNSEKPADTYTLDVPTSEVKNVLKELNSDPNVEYAEEEIMYEYFGTVNDSHYNFYQFKDFSLIGAPDAWDLFSPKKGPIVAVLDSGIDSSSADLKNMIYKPFNTMDNTTNVNDELGHGTHVAGIVGAQTNNSTGIASLSKGAKIMPVKVGSKNGISSIDIAEGIYYAVNQGANIINLSIGGRYSVYVEDAVDYAYEKGVLVIAAAGNSSLPFQQYPAAYNSVIGVAAVDAYTDSLADFSNYGDWVSIAAPGVDIFSTYPSVLDKTNPAGYEYMDGTSMASPMVASLAALLKNHAPALSHNQIRWLMEVSSEDYYGAEYHTNGRINADNALTYYNEYPRLFGKTSVDTSNEIAAAGWSEQLPPYTYLETYEPELNEDALSEEGTFAILASSKSFPDSLAANALAYKLDAPILLSSPNQLSTSTVDTLNQLNVQNVLVLGGKGAISDSVISSLNKSGFNAQRIKGTNRFSTATEINDYIAKQGGEVIIANGLNFPDALSVSAFAASNQIPIVFAEKDRIPQETRDFIDKYGFSKSIIIGGTGVISDSVIKNFPNPIRLSGKNRFETNIKVINHFNADTTPVGLMFATGYNFPDALAGGVLAAKSNYPLVLTDSNAIPAPTQAYIQQQVNNSKPEYLDMLVLGGKAAVSPETVFKIDHILFRDWYNQSYSSTSSFQSSKQALNLQFSKK